eukprot:NODE_109_length_18665_cov_0.924486.p18 type:complete len:143 gc:universal NODE_109_length_18665_cov_0.924486:1758-2186(+)
MDEVMQWYKPDCVFMQCGADSLAGDRLGRFNISMKGHGACVEYMMKFNVPMVITGGGGYSVKNVSKLWCYETSLACGIELDPHLPPTDYSEYYGPDHVLQVLPQDDLINLNSISDLEYVKGRVLEQLRNVEHAPSIHVPQNN